jgi:hypothetical protein
MASSLDHLGAILFHRSLPMDKDYVVWSGQLANSKNQEVDPILA